MKKFPGTLKRCSSSKKILFDEVQMNWFQTWYPVTENERLAKAMCISVKSVRKYARLYGLVKSEEGLAAIHKRQGKRMAMTFEKRGLYDAKRGHSPSQATMEGNKKRWAEIKEGKRKDPVTQYKELHPQKYKRLLENMATARKELVRKEKLRIIYGLERKTNLSVVVIKPFTRSQIHHRHNALKRGYLIDEDCSEGQLGRYSIYYDDMTQRSQKFEENCIKDGFKILRDE